MGRIIVEELKLEPGVDTTGRWMAHHLAEMILCAEKANGISKAVAEQDCCDLILKIWRHKSALPSRPLESFTPILETLERLSSDNQRWYLPPSLEAKGEAGVWLEYASKFDSLVPAVLRHCIAEAVSAASSKEKKWLGNKVVPTLNKNTNVSLIFKLVESAEELHDPKKRQQAEIKALLQELTELQRLVTMLQKRLSGRLKK